MRFRPGKYVMFRESHNGRRYFTGQWKHGFPREAFHLEQAKVFLSAAHAYCFGRESASLQEWRVGRVT